MQSLCILLVYQNLPLSGRSNVQKSKLDPSPNSASDWRVTEQVMESQDIEIES